MVDKFCFNRIEEYLSKLSNNTIGSTRTKEPTYNVAAVLSIFDTNYDGKISKKEFSNISKEYYENFLQQMEEYNRENPTDCNSKLFSYNELKGFLDDGHITQNELEGMTTQYNLKDKNLPETKTLKEPKQMSDSQIQEELSEYGIEDIPTKRKKLLIMLNELRTQRAIYDENSDIVDGHIGTYAQPENNNMCSLLAQIDTMSDEEITKLYQIKTDANGNKFYEVKFPQAQEAVVVTAEEIENGEIIINENGETRVLSNFTKGDADVRMLEMAFIRSFGAETMLNGAWGYNTQNRLSSDNLYGYTQNLENISDYNSIPQNAIFSLLDNDEQNSKNLPKETVLSTGQKVTINLINELVISDNNGNSYTIVPQHALQFRGYDENTNEIILSGNSMNNLSEMRIPADPQLLKYFQLDTMLDKLK